MKKKFGVVLLIIFISFTLITSVIYFNNKQESFKIRDKAKGI
jgi:hypothetical protein